MAKPIKCLINHCPYIVCPRCHHWYNPKKPDQLREHSKCPERPAPARRTDPACITCRAGFSNNRNKSWAERDARDQFLLKLHERLVFVNQHPVPKSRRKAKQVRTTRATNQAPTTKAA